MRISYKVITAYLLRLSLFGALSSAQHNSSYYNPALAGWHSDPSCTRVDDTFYCVFSTFVVFPGLPIYASKDLINWKLVSHVWNRERQLPGYSVNTTAQQGGHFAATIRYHDDTFYVICVYLNSLPEIGVLYTSKDPYEDSAWSDAVLFDAPSIDPDLFWDDDGKVYSAFAGVTIQEIDLKTGKFSNSKSIWNGTGGSSPEGPHIYKRDDYYYLMIAEGGTELNHSITIARSTDIYGPYESYVNNPILTNRGTAEWFQTVGHGDLFQDTHGRWWGMCLSTRGGPEWKIYPMGREAVLFPATWKEGDWPILEPVRGSMSGWQLPEQTRDLPGTGPLNTDPDVYDFRVGCPIPRNLVHFRVPQKGTFSVTAHGLQIVPTRANITGDSSQFNLNGQTGIGFIGRRQTDSLFTYSADFTFNPKFIGQEAGVSVFLTQFNHIDLGIVRMGSKRSVRGRGSDLYFRFRVEASTMDNDPVLTGTPPPTELVPVPPSWEGKTIRLEITTANETYYHLSAMLSEHPRDKILIGVASAQLVSGGSGTFVGSLIGAYATCNGAGSGLVCPEGGIAYVNRWRYTGKAQYISATDIVTEIAETSQ